MIAPGSVISDPENPTGELKHKQVNNVSEIQGSRYHFAERIISFAFSINESWPIDSYKSLRVPSTKNWAPEMSPSFCFFFATLKFWLPTGWEPWCWLLVGWCGGRKPNRGTLNGKGERNRRFRAAGARPFAGPALELVSFHHRSGLLQLGLRDAGTAPNTLPCLSCWPVARGRIPHMYLGRYPRGLWINQGWPHTAKLRRN